MERRGLEVRRMKGKAKVKRQDRANRARRVNRARQKFAEGVVAIVLSGEALPYFVRSGVEEAIKSGKEALKKGELQGWARDHLNEIILGLELARYSLHHLEEIVTEEDELKALTPHIREWLQEEGYEFSERMLDRILRQLEGYWDKFDMKAWQWALDTVAIEDEIEAARSYMAEWLKEKGRSSSKEAVDRFLEQPKDSWSEHGLYDVIDLSAWEAALGFLERSKDAAPPMSRNEDQDRRLRAMPDFLTREEAARVLRLDRLGLRRSRETVRYLRTTGQLGYVEVAGKVLWTCLRRRG